MPPENQPIPKLDLTSDQGKKALDQKAEAKKEVVDKKNETLSVVAKEAKDSIARTNNALQAVKMSLSPELEAHLTGYFQASIDRFDKDKDGKIDAGEAKTFADAMREKTGKIIEENSPTKEHKEAKKNVEKAAAAVETPELSAKNVNEIKEIGEQLDVVKSLSEFENLQKQNASFQNTISNQIKGIADFQKQYEEFKKSQQGFNGLARLKYLVVDDSAEKAKAAELQQKLEKAKSEGVRILNDLKSKKAILDGNAKKIQEAINAERKRMIDERDTKVKEIEAAKDEQEAVKQAKQDKYKQLEEQQAKAKAQKAGLEKKLENTQDFRKKWEAQTESEKLANRRAEFSESAGAIALEVQVLENILSDPNITPDAKTKVQAKLEESRKRQVMAGAALEGLDEKIKTGKVVEKQLSDDEKAGRAQVNNMDAYLNGQVKPALDALSQNIETLEDLKLQYATKSEQVKEIYNARVTKIDELSKSVAEANLSSALARNDSIKALETAVNSLNGLSVSREGMGITLLSAPQNLLHGAGDLLNSAGKFFEEQAIAVSNGAKEIKGIGGWFARAGAEVISLPIGFVAGASELGGGILMMGAHPIETLKGMGSLIGRNPETKEWSWDTAGAAWKNMGKAIIAYENFEKGNIGVGGGKVVFNVLSMFVGAGEAGAVAKAGSAASKAMVAAQAAAKLAGRSAAATWVLSRGAYVAKFAPSLVRTIAADLKPGFITKAEVAASKGISPLGKAWRYTSTAAVEGAKAIPGAVKGALTVAKDLAVFPFQVPLMLGRGLAKVVRLGAKGEFRQILNVYRAGKVAEATKVMEAEKANYAKARTRMDEIIQNDAKLAEMSRTSHGRLSAEAEAYSRLMKENPQLAASISRVENAAATLNRASEKVFAEAEKTLGKITKDPELVAIKAERQKLRDESTKPGAGQKEKDALAAFEKKNSQNLIKLDSAEAQLAELQKLRAQQQALNESYLGKQGGELGQMEARVAEYKSPTVTDLPEFYDDFFKNYTQAVKSGSAEAVENTAATLGKVDPASELGRAIESLQNKIKTDGLLDDVTRNEFRKKFEENQKQVAQIYDDFTSALSKGDQAALKTIKDANPYWVSALEQMENRVNFMSRRADLHHEANALRVRAEIADLDFSKFSLEEANKILANKYPRSLEAGAVEREVVTVKLKDNKDYQVVLNGEGKVVLKEIVPPAPAPQLIPHDKAILGESVSKIPENTTVAYGTQTPGGHWVEVTPLKGGEYLVVEVRGGKVAAESRMSKLEITREGGEHVLKGVKTDGAAFQYRNIQEVFKPSTYATKAELVFPPAPKPAPSTGPSPKPQGPDKRTYAEKKADIDQRTIASKTELESLDTKLKAAQSELERQESALARQQGKTGSLTDQLNKKVEAARESLNLVRQDILAAERKALSLQVERAKLYAGEGVDLTLTFMRDNINNRYVKAGIELMRLTAKLPGKLAGPAAKLGGLLEKSLTLKNEFLIANKIEILKLMRFVWEANTDPSYHTTYYKKDIEEFLNKYLFSEEAGIQLFDPSYRLASGPLTPEKFTELEKKWADISREHLRPQDFYTPVERGYIQDKQSAFRDAIDGLLGQENLSAAAVAAALDTRFGPALNDMGKSYEMTMDGITVKVSADGKRTYEGVDKWLADASKKQMVGNIFREIAGKYAEISPAKLTSENQGKPITSLEDYKKHVSNLLLEKMKTQIAGQDLGEGLRVVSRGRTAPDAPYFIATISEKGQINIEINDDWAKQSFDSIQSRATRTPPAASAPKGSTSPRPSEIKRNRPQNPPQTGDEAPPSTSTKKRNDDIYA